MLLQLARASSRSPGLLHLRARRRSREAGPYVLVFLFSRGVHVLGQGRKEKYRGQRRAPHGIRVWGAAFIGTRRRKSVMLNTNAVRRETFLE